MKSPPQTRDIALAFQEAAVDVLTKKSLTALAQTGFKQLVVAGGVGANRQLREELTRQAKLIGAIVFYPELEFCTDNGAMIAFAGALRLKETTNKESPATDGFTVKARWDLELLETPSSQ